jgi:hypothetical protein
MAMCQASAALLRASHSRYQSAFVAPIISKRWRTENIARLTWSSDGGCRRVVEFYHSVHGQLRHAAEIAQAAFKIGEGGRKLRVSTFGSRDNADYVRHDTPRSSVAMAGIAASAGAVAMPARREGDQSFFCPKCRAPYRASFCTRL